MLVLALGQSRCFVADVLFFVPSEKSFTLEGGCFLFDFFLRHALFGPEIRVVDCGVLVGVVLLAGQFGVVQAACVAERSRSVGSTSPLRRFSSVAAVAATWGCSTASTLLRV